MHNVQVRWFASCGLGLGQNLLAELGSDKRLSGERGWTRTIDPCLKRALLCQLSYAPTFFQFNTSPSEPTPAHRHSSSTLRVISKPQRLRFRPAL